LCCLSLRHALSIHNNFAHTTIMRSTLVLASLLSAFAAAVPLEDTSTSNEAINRDVNPITVWTHVTSDCTSEIIDTFWPVVAPGTTNGTHIGNVGSMQAGTDGSGQCTIKVYD